MSFETRPGPIAKTEAVCKAIQMNLWGLRIRLSQLCPTCAQIGNESEQDQSNGSMGNSNE